MSKIRFTIFLFFSVFQMAVGQSSDLFISEYVEASGDNNYIEIYNGTGSSVSLSDYTLRIYANGSSSPTFTLNLSTCASSIANGSTLVIGNPSGTIYVEDCSYSDLNFNGNDVISLAKYGVNIDVLGIIGSSVDYAKNTTLVRKRYIEGPLNLFSLFEWDEYDSESEFLGGHDTSNCSSCGEIVLQDFEENSNDTWPVYSTLPTFSTPPCSSGGDVWNYVTTLNGQNPSSGLQFWGVNDLHGSCGGSQYESITLPNTDISNYESVIFSFDFYASKFRNNDKIKYELYFDNVSQSEVFVIEGSGGQSSNGLSTNGWESEIVEIPDNVNLLKVVFSVRQNGNDEFGGLDNVRVRGDLACEKPTQEVTSSSASNIESAQADIDFSGDNGDGVLVIAREGAPVSGVLLPTGVNPTANAEFGSGDAIGYGTSFVVYKGTGNNFTLTGLSGNKTYYLAFYPYKSGAPCYLTLNVDTLSFSTSSTEVSLASTTTVNRVENGTTFNVCVDIANPSSSEATTVDLVVNDNARLSGFANPETFTFPAASATQQCITVTIGNNSLCDGDETLTFTLQNASGGASASIIGDTTFDLNITDDEVAPTNQASPESTPFDNLGPTYANIYFTGSGEEDGTLAVIRETSESAINPTSITNTATASSVYGAGTSIGDGYVLFNGATGAPEIIFITGLLPNTSYTIELFDYDGSSVRCYNEVSNTIEFTTTDNVYHFVSTSGEYSAASNWLPERIDPLPSDQLYFDNGGTVTVTSPNSETISYMEISGNTNLEFSAASAETITISGGAGDDFVIANGSSLTVSSSMTAISLATGSSASILGDVFVESTSGQLFIGGGTFVIGATATFTVEVSSTESGQFDGVLVQFDDGSKYFHKSAAEPTLSNITYSDIDFSFSGAIASGNASGILTADSVKIHENTDIDFSGLTTVSFEYLEVLGNQTLGISQLAIEKDLKVEDGATFSLSNAIISFSGTGSQNLFIHDNSTISLSGTAGILIGSNSNLTLSGTIDVPGSVTNNGTFTVATHANPDSSNNIIVNGVLTNTGNFYIKNKTGLIQTATSTLVNTGTFYMERIRPGYQGEETWNIWSSPMTGGSGSEIGVYPGCEIYATRAYYHSGGDDGGRDFIGIKACTETEPGRGYITKGINNAGNAVDFFGVVNNGDVIIDPDLVEIGKFDENDTSDVPYFMVGNPYPSAIDPAVFYSENQNLIGDDQILGTIYMFVQNNPNNPKLTSSVDFIAYNTAGAGGVVDSSNSDWAGLKIAAGQGFYVVLTDQHKEVRFKNSMREGSTDNTQFKSNTKGSKIKSRFYLSFSDSDQYDASTLITLTDGATYAFDRSYDAFRTDFRPVGLWSEMKGTHYSIQSIPSLIDRVVNIPLGINASFPNEYTFTLDSYSGWDDPVYLFDSATTTYHDLTQGGYTFYHDGDYAKIFNRFFITFVPDPVMDILRDKQTSKEIYDVIHFDPKAKIRAIDHLNGIELINLPLNDVSDIELIDGSGKKIARQYFTQYNSPVVETDYKGVCLIKVNFKDGSSWVSKAVLR